MGKMKTIMTVLSLACLPLGINSCMKSDLDDIRKELQEQESQINESASQDISVSFDSEDVFYASPAGNEITLQLPETLKESEFGSITAMVSVLEGSDVQTRGVGDKWTVTVTKPSFDADGNVVPGSAKVAIKGTEDTSLSETFILQIIISTKDGKEMTGSHFVKYTAGTIASSVADLTDNNITHLAWKGSVTAEDFEYIRTNLKLLEIADLSMAETTEIPRTAFYEVASLRKVWLPSTVTIIREWAFGNTGLEDIDLANVQEIENQVFAYCEKLKSIDIPASVTTLGRWIFQECYNLKNVTLHEGLATLSPSTFYGCGISEIQIPATVTEIPDFCFSNCHNLEIIYLHNDITSIGIETFFNCYSLKSFTVPEKVTVLPDWAFYSCSSLSRLVLHENVTEIGRECFVDCTSLRQLLTFTGEYEEFRCPKSLSKIGYCAFSRSGVENMYMYDTKLTELPDEVFNLCYNLKNVNMPKQLEKIGDQAFGMTAISAIDLPSTFKELGDYVFSGCKNISMFVCRSATVPNIKDNTFPTDFKTNCTLYYPQSSDYNSWNNYFSRMVTLK